VSLATCQHITNSYLTDIDRYLNEMRLATERKRNADVEVSGGPPKKKRGRPPGSKTMKGKNVASTSASARGDIEATPAPDASANTD
jgi:hypothetical protein